MKELFLRIRNILLSPRQEWKQIQQEQASAEKLITGYGAFIAAVPPCAAVAERILFGGHVAGRQSLAVVLATNLVWYPILLLNMIVTAAVLTFVISGQRRLIDLQGLQLAVYSFTPLFLISIVTVIPGLSGLIYAAILYSLALLYLGIRATGAGQGRAAWHTAASFFVAALIVGSLNAVEYLVESFIATKVFY